MFATRLTRKSNHAFELHGISTEALAACKALPGGKEPFPELQASLTINSE